MGRIGISLGDFRIFLEEACSWIKRLVRFPRRLSRNRTGMTGCSSIALGSIARRWNFFKGGSKWAEGSGKTFYIPQFSFKYMK